MFITRPPTSDAPTRVTPRPLRLWPFLLLGASAIAIAKISVHPRINLTRDEGGWTLRYDYAHKSAPGPADKGQVLPAASGSISDLWSNPRSLLDQLKQGFGSASAREREPPVPVSIKPSAPLAKSLDINTLWILDTGATAHMCTNRELMHSYRELPWGQTSRGFSSANGQLSHLVGTGNVTLKAQVPDDDIGAGQRGAGKTHHHRTSRLTLMDVHFYPTKGVNLLSWSQLKRSAQRSGLGLRLVEEDDSSLTVMAVEEGLLGGRRKERAIMRFRPQGGLFVLEQAKLPDIEK